MSFWAKNTPQRDLEPSRFEVDLNKVLRGEGPEEYRDPSRFFSITHATRELKLMIREINRSLETGNGLVWALKSPFGGGKTHALLVLYHAFRSPDEVPEEKGDDDPYGFPKPTMKATVVGLDGRDVPAGGKGRPRTLWGKIADELGHYELLKEDDEAMKPPEMKTIRRLLKEAGPTIILLDELPPYLEKGLAVEVGRSNLGRLTIAFLHSLLDAAKGEKAVLMITIPEEAYRERSAELDQLTKDANAIVSRIAEFKAPMSMEELAGILRRRLFTNVSSQAAGEASSEFYKLYLSKKEAFAPEALEPNYVPLVEKDYPFHPTFIHLLAERIAAVPGFQRTRGVLRLTAAVVSSLKRRDIKGAIMPGDVDLSDSVVLAELLKGHPLYADVVESDVINRNGDARAQHLRDKPFAVRCATAVFLNSFTLSGKDYASLAPTAKDIALQVARPGENPFEIQDALESLSNYLFFMVSDQEPARYFFTVMQNVVRLIEDEASKVTDTEAEERVRVEVERATGNRPFEVVYLWNAMPDDRPAATLTLLGLRDGSPPEEVPAKAVNIWRNHGTGFRSHLNAIVFAYAVPSDAEKLIRLEKRLVGCERLLSRESLVATAGKGNVEMVKVVEEINRRRLKSEKDKTSSTLKLQAIKSYANVAYPTIDKNSKATMKITGAASEAMVKGSIQETVFILLGMNEGIGKLGDRLDARYFFDSAIKPRFQKGDSPSVRRVVESFYEDPALPLPLYPHVVISAIGEGVKEGLFGVKEGESVFYRVEFSAGEHMSATIIPPPEIAISKTVSVRVSLTPTDAGSVKPDGHVETRAGEELVVDATPNSGWNFKQWEHDGKLFSTDSRTSFVPVEDLQLLAVFTREKVVPHRVQIHPAEVIEGDYVMGFLASNLGEMETLVREWPLLNSELKPTSVKVTLDLTSDKVELHLREVNLSEQNKPPIPLAKLRTILSDLSSFVQIQQVSLRVDLEGTQKLATSSAEKLGKMAISGVTVRRG